MFYTKRIFKAMVVEKYDARKPDVIPVTTQALVYTITKHAI